MHHEVRNAKDKRKEGGELEEAAGCRREYAPSTRTLPTVYLYIVCFLAIYLGLHERFWMVP